MQLYLIRHAQSTNNLLMEETGSEAGRVEDAPLTDRGRKQAEQLARLLTKPRPEGEAPEAPYRDHRNSAGFGITHLYCSLFLRAVQTAGILSQALGLRPHGIVDLHEEGGVILRDPKTGEWEGRPGMARPWFEAHHPELVLPDGVDDTGWYRGGHEPRDARRPRARRVLDTLFERHGASHDAVAVVTHGGFHVHLVHVLLGLADDSSFFFPLVNTAFTRFDRNGDRASLEYLNRADHLCGGLVSL